jgi:hypothetical protein
MGSARSGHEGPWRHDIQIVLTNDSVKEFRVLLHYESREVELALCHKLGLFD